VEAKSARFIRASYHNLKGRDKFAGRHRLAGLCPVERPPRCSHEGSGGSCNVLGWIGVHDDLMRSSDTRSRVGIEAGTFRARFDEMKFLHKAKRNEYQFTLEGGQTISLGAVNLREPAEKAALEGAGPRDSCEITIEIVKTGPTLVGYKPL